MRTTLSLRREALAALTADDLAAVHGAQDLSGQCTTILTFLTCNVTCMTE